MNSVAHSSELAKKIDALLSNINHWEGKNDWKHREHRNRTLDVIAELVFREMEAGTFNSTEDIELLRQLQVLHHGTKFHRGSLLEQVVSPWDPECPWCGEDVATITRETEIIPNLLKKIQIRECKNCGAIPVDNISLQLTRLSVTIQRRHAFTPSSLPESVTPQVDTPVKGASISAPPQYVTLDQMAAISGKSKRSLERWITHGKLPSPDVEGGGGKANEWLWSEVREILERETKKPMPERYPTLRK